MDSLTACQKRLGAAEHPGSPGKSPGYQHHNRLFLYASFHHSHRITVSSVLVGRVTHRKHFPNSINYQQPATMLTSRWATPPAASEAQEKQKPADATPQSPPSAAPASANGHDDDEPAARRAPAPAPSATAEKAAPQPQVVDAPAYSAADAGLYSPDPMADEFAQTREDDDLFDDDFTPVPEPVVELIEQPAAVEEDAAAAEEEVEDEQVRVEDEEGKVQREASPSPPPTAPVPEQQNDVAVAPVESNKKEALPAVEAKKAPAPQQQQQQQRGGARGGRGGRGGRDGRGGGLGASQHAAAAPAASAGEAGEKKKAPAAQQQANGEAASSKAGEGEAGAAEGLDKAPKGPKKEGAVRGDRSATGGIKKVCSIALLWGWLGLVEMVLRWLHQHVCPSSLWPPIPQQSHQTA